MRFPKNTLIFIGLLWISFLTIIPFVYGGSVFAFSLITIAYSLLILWSLFYTENYIRNLQKTNNRLQQKLDENKFVEKNLNHDVGFGQLVHFDQLTTLPNRIFFNESLNKTIAHAKRHNKILAILAINLDSFNNVITTEGQSESNYALKEIGERFSSVLRSDDLVAKLEGDDEPITKHLGIQYQEYEPFVLAVIQKAVKDGLSVIAIDDNDEVIACAIGEDITDPFKPTLSAYPKMKPIFALIEELSKPFLSDKTFKKGKMAHTWVAMVDKLYRGKGLSTEIDLACTNHIANKGFDFTYAEFTNDISEKITHHYPVSKKFNEIIYDDFTYQGLKPFEGVRGGAASYVLGIKPGVKIESLQECYTTEKNSKGS